MDEAKAVVIDHGSGFLKAGFAGESVPRVVFPSVFGRPQHKGMVGIQQSCVGEKALSWSEILAVSRPIQRGVITNWEHMEEMWHHTFYNELRVPPQEHPLLLTEPPFNPKANRERMVQTMFEVFGCPAVYVGMQAVMALYSCCRTTGIVLDCGDGLTQAVPVFQGFALPHAIFKTELAGGDLTDYLMDLLNKEGCSFNSAADRELVRDMKEKLCYLAMDLEESVKGVTPSSGLDVEYRLPDGKVLRIGEERFRVPEALFQPSLIGKECCGVQEITHKCVMNIQQDLQDLLSTNMFLTGGTTLCPGFAARLEATVESLTMRKPRVKMEARAGRQNAVWFGASALADISTFRQMYISKTEYEESGAAIVHHKCF